MKAMLLGEPPQTPLLFERDIPQPQLRPGEVLVRAAGVTTELSGIPRRTEEWHPRTGAVLCHEFSGEIAESARRCRLPSVRRSTV
jgi:threonine dehydrogenase-like Zn-dependent dehydrogenase